MKKSAIILAFFLSSCSLGRQIFNDEIDHYEVLTSSREVFKTKGFIDNQSFYDEYGRHVVVNGEMMVIVHYRSGAMTILR